MADLVLIPPNEYLSICEELQSELPKSIKIISILNRSQNPQELKCYLRMIGTKPDPKLAVVKLLDVRLKKLDLDQDFVVFSATPDLVTKLLDNKSIMDHSKLILFRQITDEAIATYSSSSKRHGGHLRLADSGYFVYYLENQGKLFSEIPREIELDAITEEAHLHTLRVSWLYRELVTPQEFETLVLSDLSVGLFIPVHRSQGAHQLENSRHLVAWALCNLEGSIGLVNTVSEHQNKGYNKVAISQLCLKLLSQGRMPVADIDDRQTAKQQLFESLGFKKMYHYRWGYHVPKTSSELEKFNKLTYEMKRIEGRVFKPPPQAPAEDPWASFNIQI